MATYYLKGVPGTTHGGLAYAPGNDIKLSIKVDVPSLIANGGCVDVDGNALAVPSTGFAIGDVVTIASIPEGCIIDFCECYVHTINTAQAEANIGITGGTTDGLFEDADIHVLASSTDPDADYIAAAHFCAAGSYLAFIPVTAAILEGVFTLSFHAYRLRAPCAAE